MNNPEKKERKKRINAQNAKAKRRRHDPIDDMTREEFERVMQGMAMILGGLFYIGGIDPREFIEKDQFLAELDVE